jgi:predicted SnoaL-like aldol condensation-catalyzing enzyme
MRNLFLITALAALTAIPAQAATCKLKPKQVVTTFITEFYIDKKVREPFEKWVDPGYIQHNPYAETGRDAAIKFLEPFIANNPNMQFKILRIIADGDLVAVHAHGQMSASDPGNVVVDIFRVKGCKVMEHWDVLQQVPAKSANLNGMF